MTDSEPQVRCEIQEIDGAGHLARITIDNPPRLNVVSSALIRQLTDVVRALYTDSALRVVIVTGAGHQAFVGGADVRELVELDPTSAGHYITSLHLACAALRKTPVPIIARVDGCCLGAGLEIAISCDLRVASATSTFGMPEVKLGLPSVIEAVVCDASSDLGRHASWFTPVSRSRQTRHSPAVWSRGSCSQRNSTPPSMSGRVRLPAPGRGLFAFRRSWYDAGMMCRWTTRLWRASTHLQLRTRPTSHVFGCDGSSTGGGRSDLGRRDPRT